MGDPSLIEAELQPGMIITVEPWYYNHDRGIGTFIEDVILFYRTTGSTDYQAATMIAAPSGGDRYEAELDPVTPPGIDFYVTATDGNSLASLPSTDRDTTSTLP